MAFVDIAVGVGAAVGLGEGTAALIGGGALLGAGAGALYSGITGDGNILNSALTGALIGGAGAGLGAYAGLGAQGGAAQTALANPWFQGGMFGSAAPTIAASNTPALVAAANAPYAVPSVSATGTGLTTGAVDSALAPTVVQGAAPVATGANTVLGAQLANASADPILAASKLSGMSAAEIAAMNAPAVAPAAAGLTGNQLLGYGLAGSAALALLGNQRTPKLSPTTGTTPSYIRPYTYSAGATGAAPSVSYNAAGLPVLPASNTMFFNPSYTAQPVYKAAEGGLTPNVDFMGDNAYPMSQIKRSYYATPTQMPTGAQQVMAGYEQKTNPLTGEPMGYAKGGELGGYSDGGRMLKGPGDGMSDSIPASIGNKQPARLADGEFVVPADVVSHLGNGSTDAGAKRLYAMMDKVRKARTGTKKQGKQIKAEKYLPT